MKFLVVLAALVALCAGGAIPLVPRNISPVDVKTFYFQLLGVHGESQVAALEESAAESIEKSLARYLPNQVQMTVTGDRNIVNVNVNIYEKRALH